MATEYEIQREKIAAQMALLTSQVAMLLHEVDFDPAKVWEKIQEMKILTRCLMDARSRRDA